MLHLAAIVLQRGLDANPPADRKLLSSRDWQEVCRFISENTPEDAVFLTPRAASTFRWYSNRAEVVSWKDVPQDAAGIVEWWRRMRDVHGYERHGSLVHWRSSLSEATPEELSRLARDYGATFVITESLPPLPLELVSPPNASYSVYRLPSE
jgi:hypothetical protein